MRDTFILEDTRGNELSQQPREGGQRPGDKMTIECGSTKATGLKRLIGVNDQLIDIDGGGPEGPASRRSSTSRVRR